MAMKHTDTEPLVLPADEDGRQEIAANEEHEEEVMQRRVAHRVIDAEADDADSADKGEEHAQPDEDLLANALVGDEAAGVAQPALSQEGQVEGDGGEDTAGDEERPHLVGADVADEGEGLAVGDGGIAFAVGADDPVEKHTQEHAEPDEA